MSKTQELYNNSLKRARTQIEQALTLLNQSGLSITDKKRARRELGPILSLIDRGKRVKLDIQETNTRNGKDVRREKSKKRSIRGRKEKGQNE